MNEKSIWNDYVVMEKQKELKEDITTNVLVIGGGITGILCAYELRKRNINCVVVEKDKIGKGITNNTTAFVTVQHEVLYQDLIKKFGINKAKEYLEINLKAIKMYKDLSDKYNIDYEECNSSLFSLDKEKIDLEKKALLLLGYNYLDVNKLPINLEFSSGVSFKKQCVINPLKLINELSKKLVIYENIEVKKLTKNVAYLDKYKIRFNKVIIATHFPFINKSGLYFVKMHQRRSYVVAFKYPRIEGTYCSIDKDALYFRWYKGYLIVGGNDRDTNEKCETSFKNKIKDIFKDVDIEYSWSNQDCVTIDGVPYIGRYDSFHKNWYVATGFNLWGMSYAMASSFILADLIENKRTYDLVSPKRKFVGNELFNNLKNSVINLVTFRKPRCTHLGCALHYNEIDGVYECPCHGSRFNKDGKVINGPSKRNIKT